MLWSRLGILSDLTKNNPAAALGPADRWSAAAEERPELIADIIQLGGVLNLQQRRIDDGAVVPDLIDTNQVAYDAGRRDLALQLLALMNTGASEITALINEDRTNGL